MEEYGVERAFKGGFTGFCLYDGVYAEWMDESGFQLVSGERVCVERLFGVEVHGIKQAQLSFQRCFLTS